MELNNYELNFNKNESYVKLYDKNIRIWANKMSKAEFEVLIGLTEFINKYDNAIKIGHKFLSLKDISESMNIGYEVIRRVIPNLIRINALCYYYINVYNNIFIKAIILNPSIATRCDEVDKEFVDIFKDNRLVKINNALYRENVSDRNSLEYRNWVYKALERDNYTCQCCGLTNNLEVHHILNYSQYKDLQTDLDNAITLCECCHSPVIKGSFHNTYGTRNNTKEQLDEYIANRKNK